MNFSIAELSRNVTALKSVPVELKLWRKGSGLRAEMPGIRLVLFLFLDALKDSETGELVRLRFTWNAFFKEPAF